MLLSATLLVQATLVLASTSSETSKNSVKIKVAKCCEADEVILDQFCVKISSTNITQPWKPEFILRDNTIGGSSQGVKKSDIKYELVIGSPRCEDGEQLNSVYDDGIRDRIEISSSGNLRHHVEDLSMRPNQDPNYDDYENRRNEIHIDYEVGKYCADEVILRKDGNKLTYAKICVPKVTEGWSDTSFLMRHAVDPTLRAFSAVCYLVVAVVYFILPQLRDLVGNMITSMCLCLVCYQCASLVNTFTEHGNHINFMVADGVSCTSLLGAFFWLNALGYYIWHTFRSRNIFLRLTDGRKFCYYTFYVAGFTIAIAVTAIFAHFTLETNKPTVGGRTSPAQGVMGWLGMSVVSSTIAFTLFIDLCFVLSTTKTIRKMNTYGRIHHKLKYNLRMFALLYAIVSVSWIFSLLARTDYDGLVYCNIAINAMQAFLVLYVCVFGQKRVMFLLGKTCNCCDSNENVEGLDWGEEMTAINAGY